MLSWRIERGVVSGLYLEGRNLINPWGVETADSSAFFSLEEGIGYRHKVLARDIAFDSRSYRGRLEVKMREGHWALEVDERIEGGDTVIRAVELRCLASTYLMDFVSRYRFRREVADVSEIAGTSVSHRDSNVYHQFETDSVRLLGPSLDISVEVRGSSAPRKMLPVMYARDAKGEWVVHARMIPREYDKRVIKLCSRWFQTRALPAAVSDRLLAWDRVREGLWYRGERMPYTNRLLRIANPNAYPMARLEAGERLYWETQVRIRPHGR